uniref:Uncharacterized protein n=1 Tax=Panagrolaimus sp. ES5 TaxID=591445 RepID=A0AC34G137_9BILA
MASADAVFLAAHYRAVQRKTSESSTDEPPKRRSNSILDDIKDGVSKLTGSFSDSKKKDFGRRRAMSEIATSGPTPSRGLVEDKRRQWSIKQKSIDSKIKEQPEAEQKLSHQQPHTYTSSKTAQDLINQRRGRLNSAPVQSYGARPRSESDAVLPSNRFTAKKETAEEDPDDVFEEVEEEDIHQQQPQKAHGVTRL